MTQLDRMEKKLEAMDAKLDGHLERIARMEVKINGFITIGTIVLGAIITSIIKLYIL
ncbi:MAG: hypothetical protein IIC60_12030 [Proteobacteria bacterium]|nr:hypothetical protein [Pseudomonadota bacterium]